MTAPRTYYYGHSLYTRGKPLPSHIPWLMHHGFLVVSLSPAYPEHLRELGKKSIHIPLPDGLLTPRVIDDVMRAKQCVIDHAQQNKPVLTHCNAGRNRAVFVTGLAYADIAGVSGNLALRHVRTIRPNSLANEHFAAFLQRHQPVSNL